MRDLHNLLQTVLDRYPTQKTQTFKDNDLAGILRNGLSGCVSPDLLSGSLISKGSPGQSQWATVPWISVGDTEISSGAQQGYYLVYLFAPQMDGVYLSLHQGWTYFHRHYGQAAEEKLRQVSHFWQARLSTLTPRMSFDPIDLQGDHYHGLPAGYERCNIASIYYSKASLPDNAQLVSDLKDMLIAYAELKSQLLDPTDYDASTRYILTKAVTAEHALTPAKRRQLVKQIQHAKLVESHVHEPSKTYRAHKVDYAQEQQRNAEVGFLGEELVMAYEREKLASRPDLQAQIEHVSQIQGDGAGFDIASFDRDGQPLYIEVKTTTGDRQTPFYISRNELDFSKNHSNHYCLYRLYDFDQLANTDQLSFFKVRGDLRQHFEFLPMSFASGRPL